MSGKPRWLGVLFALLAALFLCLGGAAAQAAPGDPGEATLYFFWGDGCPHCEAAKPVLADLEQQNPGLKVESYEVWNDEANLQIFVEMAARHGFEPQGVPTMFLGDQHWVGFGAGAREQIEAVVDECLASGCPDAATYVAGEAEPTRAPPETQSPGAEVPEDQPSPEVPSQSPSADANMIDVPLLGRVDVGGLSLPIITLLIAAVDGFNPCSLWVLGILLALTLRTGSRRVTLIVGLVFIFVTALVYALFIAGIFTLVSIATMAPWLRVVVALIAVTFALINIKDYFWFAEGVSLSIPESAKPGIYQRMRGVLANVDNLPALIGGTVVLAAGVSIVELACTAGFPIVWTNILAERGVTTTGFILLLLLYMLIYQIDELLIFGVAVVTLRAGKLQEQHGRVLKLVGGMLMLTLAAVMIIDPSLMSGLGSSLLVFAGAAGATLLVLLLHRVVLPRFGVQIGTEELPSKRSSR